MLVDLLQVFINNIAPILLIAAVGYWIGRRHAIDPEHIGRLLFNVFSPALVFHSITTNTISPLEFGQLFLVMTAFVLLIAGFAWLIARWQGYSRIQQVGIVLNAMWPNDGNFGLPVVSFAFGPDVLARAVIMYVAVSILNYTVGLYVASSGHSSPRQALSRVLRVPMIYMVVIAMIVNITGFQLPLLLDRSITLLSQATIPLMLVMLGLQLARTERLQHPRIVISTIGLRLLISPLLALLLSLLFQLNGLALIAFVMQASMPVAVATIIFATEFQLDKEQILGSVLATTLVSPVTLSVLILFLQGASQLRGQ